MVIRNGMGVLISTRTALQEIPISCTVARLVERCQADLTTTTTHDDMHAYKLNYLESVGNHSIISQGRKSGDMNNDFLVAK
jgi:hypothetical protein